MTLHSLKLASAWVTTVDFLMSAPTLDSRISLYVLQKLFFFSSFPDAPRVKSIGMASIRMPNEASNCPPALELDDWHTWSYTECRDARSNLVKEMSRTAFLYTSPHD